MTWAFINESNSIELIDELPRNWRNISNFYALESDLEALKSLNWYLVINQVPEYDPYTQTRSEITTTLDEANNVVVMSASVVNKTQEELDNEHMQRREVFLRDLRSRRDRFLAASDWTQTADIQAKKSEEWKLSWSEYRQRLRDLPEIYSQPPFDSVIDSNQIDWQKPVE